jgi:hypothetical protein
MKCGWLGLGCQEWVVVFASLRIFARVGKKKGLPSGRRHVGRPLVHVECPAGQGVSTYAASMALAIRVRTSARWAAV